MSIQAHATDQHKTPTLAVDSAVVSPTARPLVSRAWAGLGAAVVGLSFVLPMPSADGSIDHLPSVCLFHRLTGLPCPGCGLTRSFVCLAHGHVVESLRYHALGPLLFALVVGALFVAVAERIWANLRFTPTPGFRRIAPYVAIALFLVAWIARLAGVDPLPGG